MAIFNQSPTEKPRSVLPGGQWRSTLTPPLRQGRRPVAEDVGKFLRKAKAVTATARKIAVLFYNTLRHGMGYVDPGASYYEERYRRRALSNLQRRAKALGFVLQEAHAPA
jgi:hypothetical protein